MLQVKLEIYVYASLVTILRKEELQKMIYIQSNFSFDDLVMGLIQFMSFCMNVHYTIMSFLTWALKAEILEVEQFGNFL